MADPGGAPATTLAPDVRERVLALGRRYELPAGAIDSLVALLDLVVKDDRAPTSVRDPLRAADDHLADSLVALECEPVRAAAAIADLGSGAGFPGLPLAIALPRATVSLIETSGRKCDFLKRAVATANVANATVIHGRVEALTEGRGSFDLVTARALAPLSVVAEYAAPLLRLGGALVAWRGRRDPELEAQAELAAAALGLELCAPRVVRPYEAAQHRNLHLMLKVRETPDRFPRRPGMALKRPLGSPPRRSA
jgi:16S rRNA (guanine527-N7)-methyltransferase